MVCLYEDFITFMEESNWLNASKAAIMNVIDKFRTKQQPQFYKL